MLHPIDGFKTGDWRRVVAKQLLYHRDTNAYNSEYGRMRANLIMHSKSRIIAVFASTDINPVIINYLCNKLYDDAIIYDAGGHWAVVFLTASFNHARALIFHALDSHSFVSCSKIKDIAFVESLKYVDVDAAINVAVNNLGRGIVFASMEPVLDSGDQSLEFDDPAGANSATSGSRPPSSNSADERKKRHKIVKVEDIMIQTPKLESLPGQFQHPLYPDANLLTSIIARFVEPTVTDDADHIDADKDKAAGVGTKKPSDGTNTKDVPAGIFRP